MLNGFKQELFAVLLAILQDFQIRIFQALFADFDFMICFMDFIRNFLDQKFIRILALGLADFD